MTKVSRRAKILAWVPHASANGSHAPRNNLSPQICLSGGRQRPESTLLRSGNKRPLTQRRGRRPHRRDSFRRLPEHLGPKVKPKKSISRTRLMKTHSCFRLLTNALAGAILFTTTALQAEDADLVKVTEIMTKDLVNVPGKEVTMITVDYPPGGADPVHRHNASAFVYVLEGSIVMQMKGGEKVTSIGGTRSTKTRQAFTSSEKMRATRNPRNSSFFWSRTKAHPCSFL